MAGTPKKRERRKAEQNGSAPPRNSRGQQQRVAHPLDPTPPPEEQYQPDPADDPNHPLAAQQPDIFRTLGIEGVAGFEATSTDEEGRRRGVIDIQKVLEGPAPDGGDWEPWIFSNHSRRLGALWATMLSRKRAYVDGEVDVEADIAVHQAASGTANGRLTGLFRDVLTGANTNITTQQGPGAPIPTPAKPWFKKLL